MKRDRRRARGEGRARLAVCGVAIALAFGAAPLAAQDDGIPWRLSYFPYPEVSPNDGLMGIARVLWFRQAPWGERVTLQNSVALEAGYSTRDAWLGRVTWANPRLADGWRIVAHGEVGDQPRFGDPDDPMDRERAHAWVDVTRRLSGPVLVAVRGAFQHDRIAGTLDQASERYPGVTIDEDYSLVDPVPGAVLPATITRDEVNGRAALVLDLRDREYEVNRGALLEAGVTVGTADGESYTQPYLHARGWLRPAQPLRLTARLGWLAPVDDLQSLAARHTLPGWEQPFTIFGGPRSHRGLGIGQRTAPGWLFAGGEARFDILNVGEMGAVTLLAFADGGKPLDPPLGSCPINDPDCDPTPGWNWGMGGGLAIRVLRAATLTITASGGDGETRWYVGSGWAW